MIWPLVISCAMPRPATIRTSVAMIGWMPRIATRMPFQSPSAMLSPKARAIATSTPPVEFWSPRWLIIRQLNAPEMATTEPTLRSMPPVAMTTVMPSATSISGAPKRTMSISEP